MQHLHAIARAEAEDLVVLHRDDTGQDRAVYVHVCFPSGWRPEHILGKSFRGIHERIPGIDSVLQSSAALVEAMTERGPYVRFVWTVTADENLDHHPDHSVRRA